MKAILSIGNEEILAESSMKHLYHAIRQIRSLEPEFTRAIVWDDRGYMRWVFDVQQDGGLLITDMAINRPVIHAEFKYQFAIYPEVRA